MYFLHKPCENLFLYQIHIIRAISIFFSQAGNHLLLTKRQKFFKGLILFAITKNFNNCKKQGVSSL